MRGAITRPIYYKPKPKDAVAWRVVPSVTAVAVRRNGTALVPDVAAVSVTVTRTEGTGAPVTIASDFWSDNLIDVWYRWIGESAWRQYPFGPGITVNTAKKGIEIQLKINNVEYDRVTVPFTFDGQTGGRGATLRGPREWTEVLTDGVSITFENGTEGCQYFDVVVYEGKYYSCKVSHIKNSTNNPNHPGSAYDITNHIWQSAEDLTFVASMLILAKYALIKNLGVESLIMPNPDDPENPWCVINKGVITIRRGDFYGITVNRASIQDGTITDCTVKGGLCLGAEDGGSFDLGTIVEPKSSLMLNPSSIALPFLKKGVSRSIRLLFPAGNNITSIATELSLSLSKDKGTTSDNTKIHQGLSGDGQTSLTLNSSVLKGKMFELLGVNTNGGNTNWYLIEM